MPAIRGGSGGPQEPLLIASSAWRDFDTSSPTMTVTPGIQEGDVLVAVISSYFGGGVITAPPAGYTMRSQRADNHNSANHDQAVATKIATASEPASISWACNNSSTIHTMGMMIYRNGNALQVDGAANRDNGFVDPGDLVGPDITTAFNNTKVLTIYFTDQSGGAADVNPPTTPPGTTLVASFWQNSNFFWDKRITVFEGLQETAGLYVGRVAVDASFCGAHAIGIRGAD